MGDEASGLLNESGRSIVGISAQLANKSQFTRLAARSWCYDLAERTEARLSFNRDARMHRIDGQYRLRSHRPDLVRGQPRTADIRNQEIFHASARFRRFSCPTSPDRRAPNAAVPPRP